MWNKDQKKSRRKGGKGLPLAQDRSLTQRRQIFLSLTKQLGIINTTPKQVKIKKEKDQKSSHHHHLFFCVEILSVGILLSVLIRQ